MQQWGTSQFFYFVQLTLEFPEVVIGDGLHSMVPYFAY